MRKTNISQSGSVLPDDCVDLLIITALQEELDAVLRKLKADKVCATSSPTYYRASVQTYTAAPDYEIAVSMLSHMGNVSAAAQATQAIADFKPTYLLMVGIAGGIKDEVQLGDIVVSDQIFYFESTKEKPSISDPRPQAFPADFLLLDRVKNYEDSSWYKLIDATRPDNVERRKTVPQVHFAPIAAGEKVIADGLRASHLKQFHSKLAAIEMESFGVAFAAAQSESRPRFLAIRGISDYADHEKNDDWHEYAADAAAAFTIGFLRSGTIPIQDNQESQRLTRKTLIAIRHHSMEPLSSQLISASLPESLRSANLVELEINQTDLYDNGRLTNPVEAARRQMDLTHQFDALNTYPDAEFGYYGIAHIPLLFHIGCQLLNRKPLHLFEHNRITDQWDQLQRGGDYPQVLLDGLPNTVMQKSGDVIVRISISYPVTLEAIDGLVANPIASLHLRINQPKRDVITSDEQIRQYSTVFRDMLDEIHNKLPNTEYVHIFYAGPVTLAVNFGRQISKTIHPRIIVYNYSAKDNPPGYAWGLEVTADVNSPNFMMKAGGSNESV